MTFFMKAMADATDMNGKINDKKARKFPVSFKMIINHKKLACSRVS
jgi:hypothetical protein